MSPEKTSIIRITDSIDDTRLYRQQFRSRQSAVALWQPMKANICGRKVKHLREGAGMGQVELAAALMVDHQMDQSDISEIERGVRCVTGLRTEGLRVDLQLELDGASGSDTAAYSDSDAAVTIDLSRATATGGHAAGDSLTDIENLPGSRYSDMLTGDAGANRLEGGADTVTDFTGGADKPDLTGFDTCARVGCAV